MIDDVSFLVADSATCSNGIGEPCETIAAGTDVPIYVLNADDVALYFGTVDIEPDSSQVFEASLDSDDNVVVDQFSVADPTGCEMRECESGYINAATCDPSDPCAWSGNSICDDLCLEVVTDMFDDTADCAK